MEIVGIRAYFLQIHPNTLIIAEFVVNCYTWIDYFLSKAVFLFYFVIVTISIIFYYVYCIYLLHLANTIFCMFCHILCQNKVFIQFKCFIS